MRGDALVEEILNLQIQSRILRNVCVFRWVGFLWLGKGYRQCGSVEHLPQQMAIERVRVSSIRSNVRSVHENAQSAANIGERNGGGFAEATVGEGFAEDLPQRRSWICSNWWSKRSVGASRPARPGTFSYY